MGVGVGLGWSGTVVAVVVDVVALVVVVVAVVVVAAAAVVCAGVSMWAGVVAVGLDLNFCNVDRTGSGMGHNH